jgi:two-component system LytT family sensor kinase
VLENAIRHGIATSETKGRITFRTKRTNGTLTLEVEDNGTGLPTSENTQLKEGIGLANTRAILQHIYGSHHHFQVTRSEQGGAIATLEIPFTTMTSTTTNYVGGYDSGNGSSESVGDRR